MIILLDTSTGLCRLAVAQNSELHWHEWQAERQLSKGLLRYIDTTLAQYDSNIDAISGIGVFQGPGSFTGLRIGITVANTLASGLNVPIVGGSGERWAQEVLDKIQRGESDTIVLPDYGAEAHITKPRK